MVEHVEKFAGETHREIHANLDVLVQSEIGVQNAGAVEETPVGVPESAQRTGGKGFGRKILMIQAARPRTSWIRNGGVADDVGYVRGTAAHQRTVLALA